MANICNLYLSGGDVKLCDHDIIFWSSCEPIFRVSLQKDVFTEPLFTPHSELLNTH